MKKRLNQGNINMLLCPTLSSKSKSKSRLINNSHKSSKNKQRPKLSLKKSFSFNYITNPNTNNDKARTIQIINTININQYNNIKTESNKAYKIIDEEYLNMKNKQINKEINKVKKILININEQNKRKDEEINKQSNLIDKILNINKQAYLNTLEHLEKNNKKDKNKYFDDLLDKLYRQYQELVVDNKEKDSEIKKLKKNIKNTKKNELIIENIILTKQYNIYKNLCKEIEAQNEQYQKKIKHKLDMENEILEKNFEILKLQENLKLGSAINIQKEKEKALLINKIKEYQIRNKEMKTKIKKLNQEYNYILLSKKELEDNFFIAYNNFYNKETNKESNHYEENNNNNENSFSSNMNSNNVSNILNKSINKESINNISNTLEETVNVKEINKNKNQIFDEDNNLNTVDEEKITNIESETNYRKGNIKEQENIINNINNMNDISNKNRNKYNESFIEKNENLSDTNEN